MLDFSKKLLSLDEEQEMVASTRGDQLVLAGPGTGKTRAVAELTRRLELEGSSVYNLVFTRAAKQVLRDRGVTDTSTIHSHAYHKVGSKKAGQLISDLGNTVGFQIIEDEASIYDTFKGFYDYVIVDEAQDLTSQQINILNLIPHQYTVAVGDFKQVIFDWASGYNGDLNGLWNGGIPKVNRLYKNYRSVRAVTDIVNRLPKSESEKNFVSEPYGPAESDGKITILCRYKTNEYGHKPDGTETMAAQLDAMELEYGFYDADKKKFVKGSTRNKIQLRTIFTSKGLESDHVIIAYDNYCREDRLSRGKFAQRATGYEVSFVAASRAKLSVQWLWQHGRLNPRQQYLAHLHL